MANHAALAAYRAAHPDLTDDAAAASAYNAETVPIRQPLIPIAWVLEWAGTGPLASISEAQTTWTNPDQSPDGVKMQRAIRAAAQASIRLFSTVTTLDVDSASVRQSLGAFVAAQIITAAEEASLVALGDAAQPLYAQPDQFGQPASALDFAAARS